MTARRRSDVILVLGLITVALIVFLTFILPSCT